MVARIEPGRRPMLIRIAQVQVAIVFGLEVNDETVIVDLLDDVGHVDQLAQRFAGYRVGSFNAIHLRSPSYESACRVVYKPFTLVFEAQFRNSRGLNFFSSQNQKIILYR